MFMGPTFLQEVITINMCVKSGFKQAGCKEYLQEYLQPKIGKWEVF